MAADAISSERKLALIEGVRERSLLYDRSLDDYHNTDKKNKAWNEIAALPAVALPSGTDARAAWDALRIIFKRNMNKKFQSGQAAPKEPRWQYYKSMTFLERFSEARAESQSTIQMLGDDEEKSVKSGESSDGTGNPKEEKEEAKTEVKYKSIWATPPVRKRKKVAESPSDDFFRDAVKEIKEQAKPKSRNQLFADNLAAELDDFPQEASCVMSSLRYEIMDLVNRRRREWSGQTFQGSDTPSTSTMSPSPGMINYIQDDQSQLVFSQMTNMNPNPYAPSG